MALNDILSVPNTSTPATFNSAASAWGFSGWSELTPGLSSDIYIIGLSIQSGYSSPLDTTFEMLFEIGVGALGAEVTDIQIPYSYRQDTGVGYYLTRIYTAFLPEPVTIPAGTRISIRAADSHTAAVTYAGSKIYYRADIDILGGDKDPMGLLGFFGL